MKKFLFQIPLLILPATLPATPAITIYNDNFAVVRETIPLDLEKGRNRVDFSEITSELIPSSIVLRDLSGNRSLRILEQSYRADPLSQDLLLGFFEGKTIDFEIRHGDETKITPGKIIRAPYPQSGFSGNYRHDPGGKLPIIEIDGKVRFGLPGTPLFPELGNNNILKPTLSWNLETNSGGKSDAELSYLTGGMSWDAAYNLVAPEEGNLVDLIGWITITNQSGRTFDDALIKLLAGDVNRIQPNIPIRARREMAFAAMADAAPEVTERSFDEFHLYDLNRPVTLRDRETKQVEFARGEKVTAKQLYIYNPTRQFQSSSSLESASQSKVAIFREFKNSRENNLGIPLPKGIIRFYRQDSDGRLEFTGENTIDHTPRNETVRVFTGNAFDLVGERKQTNYEVDTNRRWARESIEIKLRNRKENESVTILAQENLYRWRQWKIEKTSHEFTKNSSGEIEFSVSVAPDGEETITYTVFYKW